MKASTLKRSVLLRRYENGLARTVAQLHGRTFTKLIKLIADLPIEEVSSGRKLARYDALVAKADDILLKAYAQLHQVTKEELISLAKVIAPDTLKGLQRGAHGANFDRVLNRLPSPQQLRAILTTNPVRGQVMRKWWQGQAAQTRQNFRQQIRLGMLQQESVSDLVVRIRGRSLGNGRYRGGVLSTSTRNAEALVRTAVNEVATAASFATYQENSRFVSAYEYVAVLDDRTTEICASLDGQVFPLDDSAAPKPPQHWGCRSTTVPVLNYEALGLTSPPETERQTYPEWFARQDAEVQNDILGPTRAGMVRDGVASFADLVASDGRRLTIAELSSRL